MRAVKALFFHSMRRDRMLLASVALLLASFQVLLALGARSLVEMDTFPRLIALIPEFLRQLLGPSLLTLMSFRGIACLGYFHVAVIAVLIGVVTAIATEPLAEIESRFLDLVLSHPMARHSVITRTIALISAAVALLLAAMMTGSFLAFRWFVAPELSAEMWRIIPRLSLNLAALLLCWGGIALLAATLARRRAVAAAFAAWIATASYMAELVSQVWKPIAPVSRYSPFHYYRTMNLIAGGMDAWRDVLVLACMAGLSFILSYFFFQRRDL